MPLLAAFRHGLHGELPARKGCAWAHACIRSWHSEFRHSHTYLSACCICTVYREKERPCTSIHTCYMYLGTYVIIPNLPHLSLLRSTAGCNKGLGKGKTAIGLPATTLQSLEGRNILNGRRLVLGRPKTTEMYQPALRCLRPSPLTPSASRCSRLLVLHSLGFG